MVIQRIQEKQFGTFVELRDVDQEGNKMTNILQKQASILAVRET